MLQTLFTVQKHAHFVDDYMHQYEKDLQVGLRSTADFRKSNPSGSQVFRVDGRRIYPDGWDLAYYPADKKGKRGN